ncbi:hypothetical protein [Candidatus Enterococcus mansonii]|uniref:Lipoprotein n=1 Tax=Candidatus Enterococcus mansonii TaxID=1834181 RepID=A0A242CEX5_9ENTE|nr:hypothetical protein [Enterococcus sp. 4G2_DIV0659]OTO08787.1 hypothetical protein A5880_001787 [Enterococcus sp. 4G2_DIV0659]
MKKFCLVGIMLLLLVGCSKMSSHTEKKYEEEVFIDLKFQDTKLIIKNNTKDSITILDSETEFSTKKNNKWVPIDETHGLLALTTNILGDDETELDLAERLSRIKEKEVKVTIHYEIEQKEREKSIVYVK